MNHQGDSWIDTALDDLAAADADAVVPATVRAAVLQAWDAQQRGWEQAAARAPLFDRVRWRAAWVLVPATAAVIAAVALRDPDPVAPTATVRPPALDSGYVIVPEPFSDTATLHVVRVRMDRMALATLGVPIADPDAEGLVDVEMVVGDDGVARSIRNATFVREQAERGADR
jgi:hypothetical protein